MKCIESRKAFMIFQIFIQNYVNVIMKSNTKREMNLLDIKFANGYLPVYSPIAFNVTLSAMKFPYIS